MAGHERVVISAQAARPAALRPAPVGRTSATGLLLRADVLDRIKGEVLESSAFSELTLGAPQPEAWWRPDEGKLDGYRVLRPQIGRTQLEAEGWTLTQASAGFQLVSCVKRPLRPRRHRCAGAADGVPTA